LVAPLVLPLNVNHLPLTRAPQFFPSIETPTILSSIEIPHVLPSLVDVQKVEERALDPKPNLDH
jgi:hypothetical protein